MLKIANPSAKAGVAEYVTAVQADDYPHLSENVLSLQAARLRRQFILSDELSVAVAALVFASGGRR